MMDEKKILAIELLVDNTMTKKDMAKKIDISRTTLYSWLEDEEFKTELDKRLQGIKSFVQRKIDAKLDFVIDQLYVLAGDNTNKRVQAQVLQYLADRSLGKPTGRLDVTAEAKTASVDGGTIDGEFSQWEDDDRG